MKYGDIQKLRESGFITDEQQQKIIGHFKLKEDSNRFLVIISFVGAVLVAAGIVLLIAANWDDIPRGVKLATGLALMLGAHAGGWWLRENPLSRFASTSQRWVGRVTPCAPPPERSDPGAHGVTRPTTATDSGEPLATEGPLSLFPPDGERDGVRGNYRKTGEALHLLGSLLFLGNIALVGQIYHLSTRPPNAFLLWWAGIAALPWLLRSKAQHLLALLAFGIWFGFEINQADSLVRLADESQVLAYSLLGLVYAGFGYVLRRSAFASFAKVTERLGLLAFLAFAYPLAFQGFLDDYSRAMAVSYWILPALAVLAATLIALGAKNLELDKQWRWTWGLTLAMAAGLLVGAFFAPHERVWSWHQGFTPLNALAALALFVFCLLQIQVGLQERSTFLVNLGVVFVALDMIAAYIGLFGTMARTGLMFVVSGVFLIVFGVYLEKKRRKFMKQIKTARAGAEGPS
jgi:uncharacterized membrane protein